MLYAGRLVDRDPGTVRVRPSMDTDDCELVNGEQCGSRSRTIPGVAWINQPSQEALIQTA